MQLGKESLSTVKSIYQAIGPEDTDSDIVEKVFTGNVRSIEETLRILDRAELVCAARHAGKSRSSASSASVRAATSPRQDALRFSQVDVQAEAYWDSYQMLNRALCMKKAKWRWAFPPAAGWR